jgi:cytoskeleton protein RodZ
MNDLVATPGARLKAERERRGLSAQKAADQLHLDAWVIDALEAGDYARIGPAVYAKGHLKKYAALLGLPASELAAEFDAKSGPIAAGGARAPVGSALDTPVNHIVTPTQMLGAVAFLALLAGVLWWKPWQHREGAAKSVAANSAASPVAAAPNPETVSQPDEVTAAVTQPPLPPASVHDSARAIPTVARTSPGPAVNGAAISTQTVDSNVPGTGRARLRLSFTADTWVDVRDAQGNKTYVGNGSANTVKSISGQAPMHVYLRSSSGVQLEINGRAVAIGPQFFAGDVARFEAGADGVLRREAHRDAARGETSAGTRPPG